MNPSLPQSVVDRAMERDPASAAAEYLAKFRTDVESFVALEAVRACLSAGVVERAPSSAPYAAFCDPSGGASDSMTLAIAHLEAGRETVVVDCLREIRAPFSPEAAVSEFAAVLKSFGLTRVVGDKYASQWPVEQFSRFGVTYEASAEPKSTLYGSLLAAINSRARRPAGQPAPRRPTSRPGASHCSRRPRLHRPRAGRQGRRRECLRRCRGDHLVERFLQPSRLHRRGRRRPRRREGVARCSPRKLHKQFQSGDGRPRPMTPARPLALTERQLACIRRAAKTLPEDRRDEFLRSVARKLAPEPSDGAVSQAINRALDLEPTGEIR